MGSNVWLYISRCLELVFVNCLLNPVFKITDICVQTVFTRLITSGTPTVWPFKEPPSSRLANQGPSFILLAGLCIAFTHSTTDHRLMCFPLFVQDFTLWHGNYVNLCFSQFIGPWYRFMWRHPPASEPTRPGGVDRWQCATCTTGWQTNEPYCFCHGCRSG